MSGSAKILVVEDSPSLARTYSAQLEKAGHLASIAETAAAAGQAIRTFQPDCVLLDLHLPDGNGLDLLAAWGQSPAAAVPVIVITANGSVNIAVDAMRAGANDFLVKPFDSERLLTTVANVVEKKRLERTVAALRKAGPKESLGAMIGGSPAMQAVYKTIETVAPSRASVFITGESGTGKELAARALHDQSDRASGPFVALNCGALSRDLLESELFGHIKGAFTGATSDRDGAAATADGGTLFLDEICEMDLDLQSKLLRFIQLGEYRRVGEDQARTADIRFLCATNRSPVDEVRAGRFREDLFHRLNVIPICLPPLREREDDAQELAAFFLEKLSAEEGGPARRFDESALDALAHYAWPGNVRELENLILRLVVLTRGEVITGTDVEAALVQGAVGATEGDSVTKETAPSLTGASPAAGIATGAASARVQPLWMTERQAIEGAITKCAGNIQQAARLLEISPSTIYRKREAWLAQDKMAS